MINGIAMLILMVKLVVKLKLSAASLFQLLQLMDEEETIIVTDVTTLAILVVAVLAFSLVQKLNHFVFFWQQQKGLYYVNAPYESTALSAHFACADCPHTKKKHYVNCEQYCFDSQLKQVLLVLLEEDLGRD